MAAAEAVQVKSTHAVVVVVLQAAVVMCQAASTTEDNCRCYRCYMRRDATVFAIYPDWMASG